MTLPKKRSRAITVGQDTYRWLGSGYGDYRDDTSMLRAHLDQEPHGQVLEVVCPGTVVTPGIAAFLIKYYRERGWDPSQGGVYHIGYQRARPAFREYARVQAAQAKQT